MGQVCGTNVSKNESSKTCGRQPLKNLRGYSLFRQAISFQVFQSLSSANFTQYIYEYIASYKYVSKLHQYSEHSILWHFSNILANVKLLFIAVNFISLPRNVEISFLKYFFETRVKNILNANTEKKNCGKVLV